jgi:hypothetical protein
MTPAVPVPTVLGVTGRNGEALMIYMGGWMKGKAAIFAIMGVVFIVLAFTMPSYVKATFLIIGIADLAAAAFAWWMSRASDDQRSGTGGWTA